MKNLVPSCWIRNIKMWTICIFILFLWVDVVSASQFTPVLIAKSKDTTFRMPLVSADLKIKLNDQRAAFEWLLIYRNPIKEWMEGELSMPMLNNQFITAFDMNIKDVLRKGMLAEKQQAKTVYERIVSRNNDPGLLEIINGNTFKLRIFPIMGEELKTIRLSYECDYNYKDGIFSLNYPFDFIDNLNNFNIEIDAEDMSGTPFIESNIDGLKFDKSKFAENSIENFSSKNFFNIMFRNNLELPLTTFSEFNDEMYFSTLYKSPLKFEPKEKPEHLTLVVDASYSQRKNNFYIERHFLKQYLKRIQNTEIKVIVFSLNIKDEKVFSIKDGNSENLISYLEKIEYLGATNYGSLNIENLKSELILVLSNGVNNMGEFKYPKDNIPVYFLNSNPDYDESFIRRITDKTNGRFINLAKNSELFSTLDLILKNSAIMNIINFEKSKVSDLQFTKYNENPDIYRITGKIKEDVSTILPVFGNVENSDTIVLDTDINELSDDISIPRLWANSKVNELSAASVIDTSAIVKLSKDFSFATKFSSFIVLERAEQYYWFNIEPPPDMEEEYEDYIEEREEQYEYYADEDYKDTINYDSLARSQALELSKVLKINYFKEHKPLYDELVRQAKINFIDSSDLKIIFQSLLDSWKNTSYKAQLVIPEFLFNSNFATSQVSKIYFLRKGISCDSLPEYYWNSNKTFKSNLDPEIDKVKFILKNSDTVNLPVKLKPGVTTFLNFNQINDRKYYGDVDLNLIDFTGKCIDSFYVNFSPRRTEKLNNKNTKIKDLFIGKTNMHIFSEKFSDEIEVNVLPDTTICIVKVIDNKHNIWKSDSNKATLIGIIKDTNYRMLNYGRAAIKDYKKYIFTELISGLSIIYDIMPGEHQVHFAYPEKFTLNKLMNFKKGECKIENILLPDTVNYVFDSLDYNYSHDRFGSVDKRSSETSGYGDSKYLIENDSNSNVASQLQYQNAEKIFENVDQELKNGDTTRALLLCSSIYDIDIESMKSFYRAFKYFSRMGNKELAFDVLNHFKYDFNDVTLFHKAKYFENHGLYDSAISIYNVLEKDTNIAYHTRYVFINIMKHKLNSIIHKKELPADERIDLMISSENNDFQHHLNLKIIDSYGLNSHWDGGSIFWGGIELSNPTDNEYFYQKQAVPGKYKIKAKFNTWNNQTEKIEKYRGRIIIERNIGSANYEKKIIEVEASSLDEEFEFEI